MLATNFNQRDMKTTLFSKLSDSKASHPGSHIELFLFAPLHFQMIYVIIESHSKNMSITPVSAFTNMVQL